MWNLKNNIHEQTKQKRTHRFRKQTDGSEGREFGGMGEGGEGIESYIFVVTE